MRIEIQGYESIVELRAAKLALDYLVDNFVQPAEDGHEITRDAPPPPPDTLAAIAPEPKVVTTPAPAEIGATAPPPPAQEAAPPAVDDDNFDVTGIPWDGRIHSSGKTKTTKGAWVRRRNLDDAYYAQILAEISSGVRAVAEEAATETAVAETLAEVPPPPAVPAEPEIPPAAEAGFGGSTGDMTWPDVVQVVMKAKVTEVVSQEQLDQKAAELGVEGGFNNLVSRPDLYTRYIMELGI